MIACRSCQSLYELVGADHTDIGICPQCRREAHECARCGDLDAPGATEFIHGEWRCTNAAGCDEHLELWGAPTEQYAGAVEP